MKTALIIIDLIEDYFDADTWPNSRIPRNRAKLVERTNDLVAICRKQATRTDTAWPNEVGVGVPIFWVRQEFKSDLSDVFPHMRERSQTYAVRDTPGSRLLRELDVAPSDTVLTKHRYSAFFETPLSELLADIKIDTVILAGITTAWCVRSTAVDAYQQDLTVILASECMDGFTERDHEESLNAMDGYIAKACSNRKIEQHFSA